VGAGVSRAVVALAVLAALALPAVAKSQGTEPVPPGVAAAISQVTSQPRYAHAVFGFGVRDLASGQVLFEQSGDTPFVPASIMKSFSTSGALNALGPDYRFRTPVFRTGRVRRGVLRRNLVLVASGDMSLGLREKPGGSLFFDSAPNFDHTYANAGLHTVPVDGNPLAGLNSLARQVARSGIRRVAGDVVIDDRLFKTFFGWPDVSVSPASPIVVNDNRIDITTIPGARAGDRATVRWRPHTAAYRVRGRPRTVAAGSETALNVTQPSPGVFEVSGQIAADAGPTLRVGEIPDPAAFARTAFIQALERAGVEVAARRTGPNPRMLLPRRRSYRVGRRVALHVSATLKEFTKVVLKTSHNPGADLMACLNAVGIGSRDCEDGLVAETSYFTGLGVDPASVYIFDGAGGVERERVTPNAMTAFFRAIELARPSGQPPQPSRPIGDAFRESLAVLGRDGDLAESQRDSPAAGHVRAKTGTSASFTPAGQGILTARNFVAYVDAKSGRQVVVAVMIGGRVPVTSIDDIFSVANDGEAIAAAMQQGY